MTRLTKTDELNQRVVNQAKTLSGSYPKDKEPDRLEGVVLAHYLRQFSPIAVLVPPAALLPTFEAGAKSRSKATLVA